MAFSVLVPAKPFLYEKEMSQALSLLEMCSNMKEAKQIHAMMFKTGLVLDPIPLSRLLSFCSISVDGDLVYAQTMFSRITKPTTFMYNAMIRGYSKSNEPEQALLMYSRMISDSVFGNSYTFPFLLKACSSLSSINETLQIHAHILKWGFGAEIFTINSLIRAYAASSKMDSARLLFERLPHHDTVSWNSIIHGYTRCGQMDMAYDFFKYVPEKNVISWTTMISGFVGLGLYKEALNLFQEMKIADIKPDKVALASLISACAHLGAIDQGRWIHLYIERNNIECDTVLECTLIDMYAKCGHIEDAVEVFNKSKKICVSVWTAIISGYAIHGYGREAVDHFACMQKAGIEPNSITFTAVLSACSHGGLVDEGRSLFHGMKSGYNIDPSIEHYGCMVDLLGRAGLLDEAIEVIETMPLEPNAAVWGAFLNACRIHRNTELGQVMAHKLLETEPEHGDRYIQAASILSAAGEWEEAVELRGKMKDYRIAKLPGCSAITIDGTINEFFAGDRSHPQIGLIHQMWDHVTED